MAITWLGYTYQELLKMQQDYKLKKTIPLEIDVIDEMVCQIEIECKK